jgi:hypothetical protein
MFVYVYTNVWEKIANVLNMKINGVKMDYVAKHV